MNKNKNSFRVRCNDEYNEFIFAYTTVWDRRDRREKDITYCLYEDDFAATIRNPSDSPDTYIGQKNALRKMMSTTNFFIYNKDYRDIVWTRFFAMWGRNERGEEPCPAE